MRFTIHHPNRTIQRRAQACEHVLSWYRRGDRFETLVDLLADAMHLCNITGDDFEHALSLAEGHFFTEINTDPTHERKLP